MSNITKQLQFVEIISNPVTKTSQFSEVLVAYGKYVEIGCNYLLNNYDTVMKVLKECVLKDKTEKFDTIELSIPTVDYLLNNNTEVNLIYHVLVKYGESSSTLVSLLLRYKESLVNYLKRSVPVEVPVASSKAEDIAPKKAEQKIKITGESSRVKPAPEWPNIDGINIKNITLDIIKMLNSRIAYSPFDDKIYKITVDKNRDCDTNNRNSYVSGSKALQLFYEAINKNTTIELTCGLIPGDTDIFFLNSGKVDRVKLGNVDLVYTTYKKIDDVLLSFDLPCCRVSTDNSGNFWISAQCLVAIFDGTVIMPEYVKDKKKLFKMYQDHAGSGCGWINNHIDKLEARINKYQSRGFVFNYISTDKPMNFIVRCNIYNQGKLKGRMSINDD